MVHIEVNPYVVGQAQQTWMDLSQDLRVAVTILQDSPTTGFPTSVAPTVAAFLEVWADATSDMVTDAEELSDDIRELLLDFDRFEYTVADQLSKIERSIE